MAITAIGSLGSADDKNNGTVMLPLGLPRAVPAGNLVVVWIAWDSVFSVFLPETFTRSHKITDSAGNIYTILAGDVDRSAFFLAGAACSIAVSQLRSSLTTSDTITVEGAHLGTLAAKAVSAWEFEITPGYRWARCGPKPNTTNTIAADPPDMTLNAGINREWLWLHGLGVEGPNTDTYTWDGDYTEIDPAGTIGGADDSNVHIRGGWRIATQGVDSVEVSSDTADRDSAQVLVALCEVPARPFGSTPILDAFNRANEDPVDNGTWNTSRSALGGGKLEIVSGAVVSNGGAIGGGSFWEEDFEGCQEVYATAVDFTGRIDVHMNASGNGGAATMDGYGAGWVANDGNAVGLSWATLGRSGNSGRVAADHQDLVIWLDAVDGHKLGLQRSLLADNSAWVHHLWADDGAGWEEHAAHLLTGFPGLDFQTGELALALEGNTIADDFGGGELPCFVTTRRPQIMRYR